MRKRKLILLLMLVLAAAAVFGIPLTRINYDLNRYLSDDTMTKRSLQVMTEEFGSSEQLRVMFADLPEEELTEAAERLNAMPEVLLAAHDPEKDRAERDGVTYQLINLPLNECDTAKLVTSLRAMFPEKGKYWVGGSAANLLDVQKSVGAEIPLVMAISVAVVLLVLLLTSHAWLEPVILLITLGISILINLGTNSRSARFSSWRCPLTTPSC